MEFQLFKMNKKHYLIFFHLALCSAGLRKTKLVLLLAIQGEGRQIETQTQNQEYNFAIKY